ncbi:MFS transporter [Kribbella sp. WER1]
MTATTLDEAPARELTRAWWPVGLAMLVIGWGGNQFTPLLMVYRAHGGFSQLDVDVFLGAYVVGLVPGLLIASRLSDRYGRRPLMLIGLAASFLGSALLLLGDVAGYPALFAGRALSGIAVGIAMAVGTAWVTELSVPGAGARRSAILLTTGFAAGPASAGVLAQWTTPALVWPYVVHLTLCLPAIWLVLTGSVETRSEHTHRVRLRVHGRFLHVVLPMAPWIFGSAGVAYAIIPQVLDDSLGRWALLFTAALTVATLVTGVLVQPIARRLDDLSTARAVVVSMALMTFGMALAAVTAVVRRPWLAVPVALVLGAAYGIAVVSGLLEVQRMASPEELSGLTGVYYALAYVGFLLPAVLAFLGRWFGLPAMLTAVALTCLGCTVVCSTGWSRNVS